MSQAVYRPSGERGRPSGANADTLFFLEVPHSQAGESCLGLYVRINLNDPISRPTRYPLLFTGHK